MDDSIALVPWVMGKEAGCALNASLQNVVYDGEAKPVKDYTQSELESAILNGKFVLHRVGDTFRVLSDINSRMHYAYEQRIESFRYETINLDDLISSDAQRIIAYIDKIKKEKGIDYIRIDFTLDMDKDKKVLLDAYYKNNNEVKFKFSFTKQEKEIEDRLAEMEDFAQFSYIFDKSLSEYDILARYINEDKGFVFVTADEIKKFVEEEF